MEEKSFFNRGNVSVTNSRFIVDNQTYAMSGVTSVKTGRKDPSRAGPIIMGVTSIFMLGSGRIAIGLAGIGFAIFWWITQKPELSVVLNSSSGEAQALTSQDESFIGEVVDALNNAIIHRG